MHDSFHGIQLMLLQLNVRIFARKEHSAAVKMPRTDRTEVLIVVFKQLTSSRLIPEEPE